MPAEELFLAGAGEATAAGAFRGQRRRYHKGATRSRGDEWSSLAAVSRFASRTRLSPTHATSAKPSGLRSLSLLYPHPGSSLRAWQVGAALLLLLAITALAVAARHRHRYLAGWLAVVSGNFGSHDRAGASWSAGDGRPLRVSAVRGAVHHDLLGRWRTGPAQRRVPTAWQVGGQCRSFVGADSGGPSATRYWSDNVTLWSHVVTLESGTLQTNPDNWVAENNLGHALLNVGKEEQAIQHFRAAVAINPSDPDSTLNIGAYEQGHKNLIGAIEQYKKVIAMTQNTARLNAPKRAQAFRNMGLAYRELGDYGDARESFQQAVNLNPDDGEVVAWPGDHGAQVGRSQYGHHSLLEGTEGRVPGLGLCAAGAGLGPEWPQRRSSSSHAKSQPCQKTSSRRSAWPRRFCTVDRMGISSSEYTVGAGALHRITAACVGGQVSFVARDCTDCWQLLTACSGPEETT